MASADRTPRDRSLHPSEGARFLFERESVSDDGGRAEYRAAVYTPDQRFEYRATLGLDGSHEVTCAASPAGPDLEKKLAAQAKLIARAAGKKLADELPPWPHRVLRWRGPGRG